MKVSFNQIEAIVQIAKQHYEATDMPMEEVANEIILELQKLCQLEPLVIPKIAEEEISPIGDIILRFDGTHEPIMANDGAYYHYADVCTMLKQIKNS